MSAQTSIETIWHIPDDLWSLIAPILGPEKPSGSRGPPHTPFRTAFYDSRPSSASGSKQVSSSKLGNCFCTIMTSKSAFSGSGNRSRAR